MGAFRAILFNASALLWTGILALFYLPLLLFPRKETQRFARFWIRGIMVLLKVCCRLDHRIEGLENLPHGPAILAAKHQSAWDTIVFHLLVPDPVFILKRELFRVPVFGWFLKHAGNIGIDRRAGFRAIRQMLPLVGQRLAEGAQIVVFPEGTRVAPGARRPYQPGIAALYARFPVPLVPIALDSGRFWGRRSFLKHPGTITLRILPPLPRALPRDAFLAHLETRIEEACASLGAQGCLGKTGKTGTVPATD
jgi:1-acyl-sn-glycerol-3-phosphate acyltransferase